MNDSYLKYQKRIVCFVDVLGFKNMLYEFEEEAKSTYEQDKEQGLLSAKANNFVTAFKEVTQLMDGIDCNYYLFSDNICITVDPWSNRDLIFGMLFTVNNLFRRLAEIGYFLRGGIDYGLMLDERDLALGVPLANAYLMENKLAIYPRVVISEAYKQLLLDHHIDDVNFLRTRFEINYLNPFYSVVQVEDKVAYFEKYKKIIENSITANQSKEQIFVKYESLAKEFNWFISQYAEYAGYIEEDVVIDEADLKHIQSLKINLP